MEAVQALTNEEGTDDEMRPTDGQPKTPTRIDAKLRNMILRMAPSELKNLDRVRAILGSISE